VPADRPPPSDFAARYADRFVTVKLENLRLIRALDRAEIEPDEEGRLDAALQRFATYDQILTTMLASLEMLGADPEAPPLLALEQLLAMGPSAREELLTSLPKAHAADVRAVRPQVRVDVTEIWQEVEAFEARARRGR